MRIPIDIHTHHEASELAIKNCYPEDYSAASEGWFSVGIHPWRIDEYGTSLPYAELWKMLQAPNVLAVGEAGLDKLCGIPMQRQEEVFRRQALMAEEVRKPLIIHLVKAADEILRLRKQLRPSVDWIIHGFRGKPAQAQQLLSHNFSLSFGAVYHPESLRLTPLHRLFLETDEADISIDELLCRAAVIREMEEASLRDTLCQQVRNVFFKQGK